MTNEKKPFGEYIKDLRIKTLDEDGAPLSLRKLAHRIQVSPTYLSKVERGFYPASAAVIERIAEALDVPKDTLFAYAEKITPDIEIGFANYEKPAKLASFMRKATELSPDALEMTARIMEVINKDDKQAKDEKEQKNKE